MFVHHYIPTIEFHVLRRESEIHVGNPTMLMVLFTKRSDMRWKAAHSHFDIAPDSVAFTLSHPS